MEKFSSLVDIEEAALKVLSKNAREFYTDVAGDGTVFASNRLAYKRWFVKPRVLRDVSTRKLNTRVLGAPVSVPFGISPTGMQKIAHPDGEIGVVRAVEQMGSVYTLSIFSTCTIEEVAAAAPNARKWFQLSIFRQNRHIATELVQRAEAAGFEAIVLTVDFPMVGRRRNRYELPEGAKLVNLPALDFTVSKEDSSFVHVDPSMPDQTITWEDLKWLQSVTKLPFVLKGILSAEDAKLAVEYGAKAIFVSNHGGRQHDSVLPTIDALPDIVKEVGGRCDVYVDGGITTGSDVFKALALGADMAFIGRPALWGLAVGGQGGATRVLEILRDELDVTMALSGISNVAEIDSKYIARHPYSPTERRH